MSSKTWLILHKRTVDRFYPKFGKRLFDLVFGVPGLFVLFPFILAIGIIVKLADGGQVFFRHQRMGKDFRKFYLYKFRTMAPESEKKGLQITSGEDKRITPVGRFLRKYKLDELPQLFNVIKGDLSLVGPRPEVEKYVNLFLEDYREILLVRPGITDFAAIEYRNEEKVLAKYSNVEEGYIKEVLPHKIKLYQIYLEQMSLTTDLKIIFQTLWSIVK
ncbi:MAG TPA: sugar transferase [Caldithrix sp.]|nr:sugar transferase [Caldithrix sp.]